MDAYVIDVEAIKRKIYANRYKIAAAGVLAAYVGGTIVGRRLGVRLSPPSPPVVVPKPTPEMAQQIKELLEAIDKDTVLGVKIQVVKAVR